MLSVTADSSPPASLEAAGTGPYRIEVLPGLKAAEQLWRAMERDAPISPYQRFDWVAAYAASTGSESRIQVAVLRDEAGRPALLMPLDIETSMGARVASWIGGKHSNFNLPLAAPGAEAWLRVNPEAALRAIGRAVGVDVFALALVPRSWAGEPGLFAALGAASPSNAYEVRLGPDPEAVAVRSMSNEGRKRLRNKERGLAKLGEVAFGQARSEAEVQLYLDAFFRQKEDRFRTLGIPDPFLAEEVRTFIRTASLDRLGEGRPAIELYALTVGGRVASVLGGAGDGRRLSAMFLSFEPCQETMKYSPGDILVSRLIREQCLRGREHFDLGVGEARYKHTFCDETVELADVFLPVTARGSIYAAALRAVAALKRLVKQSPQAMRLVAAIRRAKAGM
jgi:CelD/BcsL family acetyltransferase involved in cellulose biosynthesis